MPDVEVRIVDSDTGVNDLPAGEIGEIIIMAPQLMTGYWQRLDETALVIRNGWLYTGDLGYMDDDGYVFIVDRKKDLVKSGGFQVWPREVEEVIATHPSVSEVAVAGVPDPDRGESSGHGGTDGGKTAPSRIFNLLPFKTCRLQVRDDRFQGKPAEKHSLVKHYGEAMSKVINNSVPKNRRGS